MINIFNSDNDNIACMETQSCQIMTTSTCIILKFESMIKKSIVTNHAFSTFITFSRINSPAHQFYHNIRFIISNLQKAFHQDNLLFVYLQFHKHNYLNKIADNISDLYASKESI